MADQGEHYDMSWILHHILDRMIGSRDTVDIRRKLIIMDDYILNGDAQAHNLMQRTQTGGRIEGFIMKGSDIDFMFIDFAVKVMCHNEETNPHSYSRDKTVFIMRKADSRPCYVTLELVKLGRSCNNITKKSIVKAFDLLFISSEKYAQCFQESFSATLRVKSETHGPATCVKNEHSYMGGDGDLVLSFPCASWPPVANEWLCRPRLHGWPEKALIYNISQSGCHVVPVGDKTSADTFLQLRISFATAERKLIHSLSHTQFLVYGLLKYFLKQISEKLKNIIGDADILSSYIMKTVLFFAVENTTPSLWKEQNTFLCFMHCLKILISWIHAGYCPNYFIIGNNMFQGKLHVGNQQKLLRFLTELYDINWMCLSVETFIQPSIGMRIESVMKGEWQDKLSPKQLECDRDMEIFNILWHRNTINFSRPLTLLSESKSDMDELIAYIITVSSLSFKGMQTFGEHIAVRGNKEKYKSLRKCKNLMKLFASMSTSPGQLTLATYYYHTGNLTQALMLCGNMISSFKLYLGHGSNDRYVDRYEHLYCGRGFTLLQKYKEAIVSDLRFTRNAADFCISQLQDEMTKTAFDIIVPPLPYAVFLSFLCYHELGDTRRRDTALYILRTVKYDEEQGGAKHWIVHNLIGICYETVGNTRRAIRKYSDSLNGGTLDHQFNPAMERIERLLRSQ